MNGWQKGDRADGETLCHELSRVEEVHDHPRLERTRHTEEGKT